MKCHSPFQGSIKTVSYCTYYMCSSGALVTPCDNSAVWLLSCCSYLKLSFPCDASTCVLCVAVIRQVILQFVFVLSLDFFFFLMD